MEAYKKIPTFIFAEKTYSKIQTLIEKIVDFYVEDNTPKSEQFDFIIVNNKYIIFNSKKDSYFYFSDESGNKHEGIFFVESGDSTLLAFLYWLNRLPLSEIRIMESLLNYYLFFAPKQMQTHWDLNARLLNITESSE
jgi:hypothetical protein